MLSASPGAQRVRSNHYPPAIDRRGGRAIVWLLAGLAVGAGGGVTAGYLAAGPHFCACPAILVLGIQVRGTSALHGAGYTTYDFIVVNVSNGNPTFGNLAFYFFNRSGSQPTPSSNWLLTVGVPGGFAYGRYDWQNGSWPGLVSVPLVVDQFWNLTIAGPSLDGGSLTVFGVNGYSGFVSFGIP